MEPLTYKPRPKMRSWAPPAPPRPRRSHFYLWATVVWGLAIAAGYYWMSDGPGGEQAATTSSDAVFEPTIPFQRTQQFEPARLEAVPAAAPEVAAPSANPRPDEILPCEAFLNQANESLDNRLPAHLGRSPLDQFIGDNAWAKPCRTKQRRTVELCVAIRDGAVRGLTIHAVPKNLTLENCLREQAAKLALQPEASMRVIRTTLAL